ncbi:helix-turn-helix domain-containing protein [Amycolatopsis sp. NPDC088138]|uniref:helix-turn-helix domain-containing protein n=1 Tax=Amycolatopsis sp. NPDC088138 TaxID=3363938 RepID=UPI0037F7BCA1
MPDTHRERLDNIAACPTLQGDAGRRSYQGNLDALSIAVDVRELDPHEVWGRINRWGHNDPQRLLAALISLAAMVDPDEQQLHQGPAWCEPIGGVAALHPDHGKLSHNQQRSLEAHKHDDAIIKLAEFGNLTDREIAMRLGISTHRVFQTRIAHGLRRNVVDAQSRIERDQKIAELEAQGADDEAIARTLGCSVRTVERSRRRAQEGAA